jgi:ABC-type dipeptide/oligopeptide/nickel transport system permease component/predicted nuclease with TOPRIM domain
MTFEIIFILALVGLQVFVFFNVFFKIKSYQRFFPSSFKEIQIKKFFITKVVLSEPEQFDKYLDSLSNEVQIIEESDDAEQVELLVIPNSTRANHSHFSEVIKSTNAYLCKNKGASADFGILKDTCERHLEKVDNEIGNLINVPLYIGLGGTFVGIIIGLWGIDFSATTEGTTTTISSDSIAQLLNGVIAAMFASLMGLAFTVINSALVYKPAAYKNDTDKNHYYDFLQRELLPFLNIGVSKSLGSFKDVLNHFIIKFGENMDDYKDSGHLLNENLQKQQTVLEEINKLSLTRTATKIAEVFADLKESAEHLEKFQAYQKSLNGYVDKTEKVTHDMNVIIDQFKDFNVNLKAISNYSVATIELQKQFKDSLEKHFPTINDHREIWRTQVDELNQDIKEVYKELNSYFKTSTEQIQSFIGSNNNFFTGINEIQNAIKIFVENSSIQKDEFNVLKNQIVEMRNDFKDSQKQSIETNKALIEAIIDLKKTISKIEIPTEK